MKNWYESKVIWAMVVQSLISALLLAQEWYSQGDFSIPGIIGLVVGILVIILRVWFTDTPIDVEKMRSTWTVVDGDTRARTSEADPFDAPETYDVSTGK